MIKFYDFLLTVLGPFIRFIGKIHMPFSRKKITGKDYYKWRDHIETGMVFLTKTEGEFSNLINPTKIKHAGIYVGELNDDGIYYVLESVGKGSILTDLVTFLTTKDVVVICKPKFIRNESDFKYHVKEQSKRLVGIPYDYLFRKGGKAYYCFELVAAVFQTYQTEIALKCKEIVKGKRIFDENTFLEKEMFEVIIDTRDIK